MRVSLWQRATALGMLFAFFTVNCGQLPLGVTQGQVDTAISELYTGLPTGTVYYSHNHLGSGNLVTNAAGNEIFRVTYDEYGQIDLENSGKWNATTQLFERNLSDAELLITAVKYTGQEYDPETGLYYYNARYYDPQLGVFTTMDTKLPKNPTALDYNRHMYVRGNPLKYTDPSGHFAFLAVLIPIIMSVAKAAIIGGAIAYTTAVIQNKGNFKAVSASTFWAGAAAGALSALGGMAAGWVAGSFNTIGNFGQTFANHMVQQTTQGAINGATGAIMRGENVWAGMGKGFVKGAVSGTFDGLSAVVAADPEGPGGVVPVEIWGALAKNATARSLGESHTDDLTAYGNGLFTGVARAMNIQLSRDDFGRKLLSRGQELWNSAKKIRQVADFAQRVSGQSPFREYLQREKSDECVQQKQCFDSKTKDWGDVFSPIKEPIQNYVNDISKIPEKAKEAWEILSHVGELTKNPEKVGQQISGQASYWPSLGNVPFIK